MSTLSFRKSSLFRYISFTVLAAFVSLLPVQPSYAQVSVLMPPVGQMIHITNHFEPPQMVGLKINLKDPFSFGFIMDQGENSMSDAVKKEEFNKIVKYFLVSLAMPNKDMWVNLSPFESKRIIPEVFGQTEMGRDLLSQDYVLKQFTASLMYPEEGLGKKFWDKVYSEAQARFGTTDINVNTFNKVWIVADHADVYQKGDTAFLVGSHLKVMLEQDYMAIEQNKEQFGNADALEVQNNDAKTQMASQVVREIIIPAIEKEVNEGQSFAAVRQIYNAEILATWFKKTLRASLLGQVFADQSKIAGQRVSDPQAKEKIFQQYLKAYKRGVFNYIKREPTSDGQMVPRRYLSGGMKNVDEAMVSTLNPVDISSQITRDDQRVQGLSSQMASFREMPEATRGQAVRGWVESNVTIPSNNTTTVMDLMNRISNMPQVSDENSRYTMQAALLSHVIEPNASEAERADKITILANGLKDLKGKGEAQLKAFISKQFPQQPNITSEPIEIPTAKNLVTAMAQLNLPQVSQSDQNIMLATVIHQLGTAPNQAQEVATFQSQAVAKPLQLAQVSLAPAAPQAPINLSQAPNGVASIAGVQEGLSNQFTEATANQSQYMPLYTQLLTQQPNLPDQVGNADVGAASAVNDLVAQMAEQIGIQKENLAEAQQAIKTIGAAHLAAEQGFTKQLSSMVPVDMIRPLAQQLANDMIRNNTANSFVTSIPRIQQGLTEQFNAATTGQMQYMPLYTQVLAQQPNLPEQVTLGNESAASTVNSLVTQMAGKIGIQNENLAEAQQAVKAIGAAHLAAEQSFTRQLSSMVPANMVRPLAQQLANDMIRNNTVNGLASIPNVQRGLSDEFTASTAANTQYMPLYTQLLGDQPNLPEQISVGNESAASAVNDLVAQMAEKIGIQKENLAEAQQAIKTIGAAHYAVQQGFAKQLGSMVPVDMVRPLAQQLANDMIRTNTANSFAASMPRIQQGLAEQFAKATSTGSLDRTRYMPVYERVLAQEPNFAERVGNEDKGAINDLLAGMAEKIGIEREKLAQAQQAIQAIGKAHWAAEQSASRQLHLMVPRQMLEPVDMVRPLAQQMANEVVSSADKSLGGINLSDEHLTMNIKLDGAGMPLPPQYQDKALMNLNGLTSIIRSITPLTQQNVPALYELTK